MITKLQIIMIVLSLVDLTATYFYISAFHTKFPQLDYLSLEANPILKMSMQKLGLPWGYVLGAVIVFAIFLLLIFSITEKWQMFLTGALSMMCIYHILNFSQLAALRPVATCQ